MSADIITFSAAQRQLIPESMTKPVRPVDYFDLNDIRLAALIEDDGHGAVRLIVNASVRNGSTATVFEGRFGLYARALAFCVREFDIVDPIDCRGPDGEGYFG